MSDPLKPSQTLAGQVRYWRTRRKLSAQALADRIADIGGTQGDRPALPRVAISRIENGDRGVTLDEWLLLAHALAVPPPLLLLDLATGADVRIADEVVVHPWLAWEWITGNEPPVMSDRSVTRVEEFSQALTTIRLYRREREAADAVHSATSAVGAAEYADDSEALRQARMGEVEALRRLASLLDEMVENDMQPPALPKEWVDTMRSLKLLRYPNRISVMEERADG